MAAQQLISVEDNFVQIKEAATHSVVLMRLGALNSRGKPSFHKTWDTIWDWLDSDQAIGYWYSDVSFDHPFTPPTTAQYTVADYATRFSFTDPDTAFAFKLRFA